MVHLASRSVYRIQALVSKLNTKSINVKHANSVAGSRLPRVGEGLAPVPTAGILRFVTCRLCGGPAVAMAESGELSRYQSCPGCAYSQLRRDLVPGAEAERARYLLHNNDPANPRYRAWLQDFIQHFIVPFARKGASILDFGSGPFPALAGMLGEL
ncbi:MAG: hypothetical protein E4H20_11350, partial [Spirochaetales bacterium]